MNTAELKAGGNIASVEDNNPESSLSSPEPDEYNRHSTTGLSPNDVDKLTNKPWKQDQHAPDKSGRIQSGISPEDIQTDNQTEQSLSGGNPANNKGKVVDSGNWSNIEFDEAELDPQIQHEILEGCNQLRNGGKIVPGETRVENNWTEPNSETSNSEEGVITRKELVKYL
ncbi:hypothetical protein C0993_003609 [Termitomyces sp. T159_Od127]|nr:hypothetical protein C0993_003609 [Termitomyces sp. T159_Od127]